MRQHIYTDQGAKPIGPYSQAIIADGPLVFVSGQGPVDPETGEFRFDSFQEQAELTFNNVTALLTAAGTSWAHVVRVGVFLADLKNFAEMNKIYQQYLSQPYPARTTVQAGLPAGMEIEVDCIAVIPQT
ncbi:MAG TPA: Rid family detoxifying hydrolase [Anaerolineae bacterium]|jgi:2-iminobutanoate/2-iminopropanoate deaminase